MRKIIDEESAVPFDDLIISLFENKDDKDFINEVWAFVIKNKYDYSCVHLYTLTSCCVGYLNKEQFLKN